MSLLAVYADANPIQPLLLRDFAAMAERLEAIGVCFERWSASAPLADDASQEAILAAYRQPVERLQALYGFASADVISVNADHPDKAALRQKFLSEHTHDDFEVRFFVGGRGLFFLHPGDTVYAVLCEQGDLLSVPANVPHWFDMGAEPCLQCIRLFTTPEGWVARFTGNDIAERFPKLEDFCEQMQ